MIAWDDTTAESANQYLLARRPPAPRRHVYHDTAGAVAVGLGAANRRIAELETLLDASIAREVRADAAVRDLTDRLNAATADTADTADCPTCAAWRFWFGIVAGALIVAIVALLNTGGI